MKQSELFDVIITTLGQPPIEKAQVSKKREVARLAGSRLQVLVAEDNQVNQLVTNQEDQESRRISLAHSLNLIVLVTCKSLLRFIDQ